MPYACKKVGDKWELTKVGSDKVLGTHGTKQSCVQQMRAVYSSELKNENNIIYNGWTPFDAEYKIQNAKDEIHVVIDSQGGDFMEAISFHNKLRNSGKRVITHVNPFALSAGAIVAIAGDEVYMVENGMMMFHPPALISNQPKDAEQMEKSAEALRAAEQMLVNTLMSKTKMSEEECRRIVSETTWLTPDEALKMGIINEIIPIYRDVEVKNFFPEKIVNFIQEKKKMPVKEVCQQLGIQGDTDEALINHIRTLESRIPKPKTEPTDYMVNMTVTFRNQMLDNLVNSGKLTPVAMQELKTKYVVPDRIKNDIMNESQEFDNIINTLSKNDKIINFGSSSGDQKAQDDDDKDVNVLVDNMKERAKQEQF